MQDVRLAVRAFRATPVVTAGGIRSRARLHGRRDFGTPCR